MSTDELTFRVACEDDAPAVAALVNSAFRGPQSRVGWTTEADLLDGQRIDAAGVAEKVTAPDGVVLLALAASGEAVGCCEVVHRSGEVAHLGLLTVAPALQSAGVGRRVLAEAEVTVRQRWAVEAMEMTVIAQRAELVDWYLRRGYALTGQVRPFPYDDPRVGRARRDDLHFLVLRKHLA